jgi:hypothetical protein
MEKPKTDGVPEQTKESAWISTLCFFGLVAILIIAL